MAGGHNDARTPEADPATAASDALSLHTIAEQYAYTSQEQADADYAFALALEEEESQRRAHSQNEPQEQRGIQAEAQPQGVGWFQWLGLSRKRTRASQPLEQHETYPPYRDDPDSEGPEEDNLENLPPYRDDPDAVPVDGDETVDVEIAATPARQGQTFWRALSRFISPYRDDPDAVSVNGDDSNTAPVGGGETIDAESGATPARRGRTFLRVLKKLGKLWLCLTLITILISIVIGVVFVVVVLTKRKPDPKDVAWDASGSQDHDLKLPKLYPALEEGADGECKRTWERYAANVYCHRMILSQAWDNGNAVEVTAAGADPYGYKDDVCTEQCRISLMRLETPMMKACYRRTDRFDLVNYGNDGKAYFDKDKVEQGPVQVAKSLTDRYYRFCARPSTKPEDESEWGTCTADVWMRWGVVDGKNEANMNGLEKFLEQTNEKHTTEGGRRQGTVGMVGGAKTNYDVQVPTRKVGPGPGETDCGYCTLDWLERKMRSFEYGGMLDPESGEAVGLADFAKKLHNAILRCDGELEASKVLNRVYDKWIKYGWWCDGEPCQKDRPVTEEVRKILHGMREDDWPLTEIRKQLRQRGAPKEALQALGDGMASMPCSIRFSEEMAMRHIIPFENVIQHLCSDTCRNAVDRIQQQHGEEFAAAARSLPTANIFQAWDLAREQVNKTCANPTPDNSVTEQTSFCAPGYAALGHPEQIFAEALPSKPDILFSFSYQTDRLYSRLPSWAAVINKDAEWKRITTRRVQQSVCNPCARELLMGRRPDYKKRIDEFLDDEEINGREYTRVAKKYVITCLKMVGVELSWDQKRRIWETIGLDRYD